MLLILSGIRGSPRGIKGSKSCGILKVFTGTATFLAPTKITNFQCGFSASGDSIDFSSLKARMCMNLERIGKLEALGFVWSPRGSL